MEKNLKPELSIAKDFLLVAGEYCVLLENMTEYSKKDFLDKIQKILGLIYIKASVLPPAVDANDVFVEKFVQEEDWQFIQSGLANKLGSVESFFDVYTPETLETDNAENISLSEGLTDVYQDMKDIVTLYQIGNKESMDGGLIDCKLNFERYWGPRLLATLSIIHNIIYWTANLEDEDSTSETGLNKDEVPNTDNWLINKKFEDFNN